MRKTPKEIAECGNQFEKERWLSIASVEEICGFITYTPTDSHDFQFARIALEIRIARNAEFTNRILVWLTVGIFILTAVLLVLTFMLVKHG
jgi:hypothetical protein